MKWTYEYPVRPGFYWVQRGIKAPWIIAVYQKPNGILVNEDGENVAKFTDAQWAGPIPEPKDAEE